MGCTVTSVPSYGSGSFEVYAETTSMYGNGVTTGECDIWIRDRENHPVDVNVQVNSLKGVTKDMSQTTTCDWVHATVQSLTG